MPAGPLVTVPLPVPIRVRVRLLGGSSVKDAVQARAAAIVTLPSLQSGSPLQPANVEPGAGVAVKVTTVDAANEKPQVAPQVMPSGLLVIDPVPVPAFVIVSV